MKQQLFEQLDTTREIFRGVAEWRFLPGDADKLPLLKQWIDSRGL